jgi:hypothetical protein
MTINATEFQALLEKHPEHKAIYLHFEGKNRVQLGPLWPKAMVEKVLPDNEALVRTGNSIAMVCFDKIVAVEVEVS